MVRAAANRAWAPVATRAVVAGLTALMLLSSEGVAPGRVDAGQQHGLAIAIRERQARAQGAMRRADVQIRRLERRQSHHARRLHEARRKLERAEARRHAVRRRTESARDGLATQRAVRDRVLRVHPDPTGRQAPDRPSVRRRVSRLQHRVERLEVRLTRLAHRTEQVRRQKERRARHLGRQRLEARRAARERAEARLAGQIGLMLGLSKDRASEHAAADLRRGFRRPARGAISQGYGCQTRHGRHSDDACGRFHDGIDIATRRGARVRASADGYVAYVGWNPWDRGRRAFVVIIGHARGLETVYAHLRPVRLVKAGQRVERGQSIGVVGLTGHTSGPHVHWEVSHEFRSVDPLGAGG